MDQATAVGRELFSGMFEEFPNLKFIHTMFGGNWFAQQKLLTPKKGVKKEAMLRLDMTEGERITKYLPEQHLLRHDAPGIVGQRPGGVRDQGLRRRPRPVRHDVPGVLQLDERQAWSSWRPWTSPKRSARSS